MSWNIYVNNITDAVISTCPVGMIYACVTSGCQPTCDNPTADESCTLPNTSSCVCPSGQLLLDGVCTPVCPSGCADENGIVHEVGVWVYYLLLRWVSAVRCVYIMSAFEQLLHENSCGAWSFTLGMSSWFHDVAYQGGWILPHLDYCLRQIAQHVIYRLERLWIFFWSEKLGGIHKLTGVRYLWR